MSDPLKLYTFEISHFSEKIRWCLDSAAIPYEEVKWTPFFHIPRALWKSRKKTTVPILETRGEVVQDSTAILQWLEAHRAPFALMPAERGARDEVLAIEDRLDRAGSYVIRCAYNAALAVPGANSSMLSSDNRHGSSTIAVGSNAGDPCAPLRGNHTSRGVKLQ